MNSTFLLFVCFVAFSLCLVNLWHSSLAYQNQANNQNWILSAIPLSSSSSLSPGHNNNGTRPVSRKKRSSKRKKRIPSGSLQLVANELETGLEPHCAAAFGQGFTQQIDFCSSNDDGDATDASKPPKSSQFFCQHNPTLSSSLCQAFDVKLDKHRISVTRGGEAIDAVMGRDEKAEYPSYQMGAFELLKSSSKKGSTMMCPQIHRERMQQGQLKHYMWDALTNVDLAPSSDASKQCEVTVEQPTLLVTRYEYCNLYHTMTDWFNVFETVVTVSRQQSSASATSSTDLTVWDNYNVVLMDGHAIGALDDTWKFLFSSSSSSNANSNNENDRVKFLYQLPNRTCFKHAIWVPPGYLSALFLFKNNKMLSCRRTKLMADFAHWFHQRLVVDPKTASYFGNTTKPTSSKTLNLLLVSRVDYLAHPRQKVAQNGKQQGKVTRQMANEAELIEAIQKQRYGKYEVQVKRIELEYTPMPLQVQAFSEADIVLGVHGAGLSHSLFLKPDRVLIELVPSCWRNPHFRFFSHWAGLHYLSLDYHGSCKRDKIPVNLVVEKVTKAVEHLEASVYKT